MNFSDLLVIIVAIGGILLCFYLRKKDIEKYTAVLEEARSIIKAKWINPISAIEGEYNGRKVRCQIEGFADDISISLKMQPRKFALANKKISAKEEWINLIQDYKYIDRQYKPFLEITFNKDSFIRELIILNQYCEKVEKDELRFRGPNI